jgi:acetolactate synthase-1/3 small subunit
MIMGEPGTKEVFELSDLQATGKLNTGRKHVLSILVENQPGVLARISSLFARRGYNIDTLAVGPTDDDHVSRITLTIDGAEHPMDQVTKQLHKLVHVLKIRDLEPQDTVARELALFKIDADAHVRTEIVQLAEIFKGSVVDVARRSITVEITGSDEKIEAFEALVRPFGLIEMVRTGEIAVQRGRTET